jgi:hypothetical protein
MPQATKKKIKLAPVAMNIAKTNTEISFPP